MIYYRSNMKNVLPQSEKGFTMVEMLLSVLLFLLIVSMLPLGMKIILDNRVADTAVRKMEWEVFSSQVKKEIRSAQQLTVQSDKLLMKVDGQFILYEKYASSMRRRVNYQGHEILVQNLSSFSFGKIADGVEIKAKSVQGGNYSVRIHQFYQTGGVEP
ncbi:competence type IV pilus minor pilin ComGF [Mesobacillus subterraneus]|uniref:competence type IV pilus minor pilin ComGF n=1 Tax=Mesobacillus subterraneus TaxID=285983 RepID=UPI001CFCD758|nr:competence type IV pilus minor pilin ComGF [Mesobacillus subterraneus]WLR56363.1 competence type IV pilus minor pilin ComGF [Mesobacillus subterraneus]